MAYLDNPTTTAASTISTGDTRNNSLDNVRWCSFTLNNHNNTLRSRICGKKFHADIQAFGERQCLGLFTTAEDAFHAPVNAKRTLFPETVKEWRR